MAPDIKEVPKKDRPELKTAHYVCSQCGAQSNPTFFAGETIPVAINCWKCLAGRHMTAEDQVRQGLGAILQPGAETRAKVLQMQQAGPGPKAVPTQRRS